MGRSDAPRRRVANIFILNVPASRSFPLIAVVGPTGAGKSDLALFLAEQLGGEIVNYDSVQVYRGLEIGAAKVPPDQRKGIPHHLIDIIDLDDELTAGEYARRARQVLTYLASENKIPILVGGTGFYLRALLDGLSPAPGRDETLRNRLSEIAGRQPAALHRFLRLHDPASAARIHPNDHQKLIRAIELTAGGQPASKTQSAPRERLRGFEYLKIGLAPDRPELYRRLDERTAGMFHGGLLEEMRELLEAGYTPECKALQSLGYKQAAQVLAGEISVSAAIRKTQTKTRQYAKRQITWFRTETDVRWLNGFGNEKRIQSEASRLSRDFLNAS